MGICGKVCHYAVGDIIVSWDLATAECNQKQLQSPAPSWDLASVGFSHAPHTLAGTGKQMSWVLAGHGTNP